MASDLFDVLQLIRCNPELKIRCSLSSLPPKDSKEGRVCQDQLPAVPYRTPIRHPQCRTFQPPSASHDDSTPGTEYHHIC